MPIEPSPPGRFPVGRLLGQELILLAIDEVLPRVQIRRQGRPALGLGDEFVPKDHAEVERDPEVPRDEVGVVEFLAAFSTLDMHKDVEIFEEGDQDAEEERDV